jgi:HPt (histidine-containing phosphotransfer) domain-containing protein
MGVEVLEHLRGLEAKGSPGLAAQVIEMFLRDTSTRLASLREAIARRDVDATYRLAHTLQGSAAMVGAASMARSCAELTSAARGGSFDRCEAIVTELDSGFQAIQRVVIAERAFKRRITKGRSGFSHESFASPPAQPHPRDRRR